MKRTAFLSVGIAAVGVILPSATVRGADGSNSQLTAPAIYSHMVAAMRELPAPGSVTYEVSFEPHGMTIGLIQREKAMHVGLLFSSSAVPSVFNVRDDGDGTVDVADPSGKRFVGPSTFFAATWNEARSLSTRAAAFESPAPHPSGTVRSRPTDDGQSSQEDTTRRAVIGDVATFSDRYYTMDRLPDAEPGVDHLRLRARSDAIDHPLTDVYVDRQTGLPVRVDAHFRNDVFISGYQGTMTLRFGSVEGHWIVVGGTVSAKGHFMLSHASGTVDYRIEHVRFGAVNNARSVADPQ